MDMKRLRLYNHMTSTQSEDQLHCKATQLRGSMCPASACYGSLMKPSTLMDQGLRSKDEVLKYAKDFIEQYFSSIKRLNSEGHEMRWKEIEESIVKTGTYKMSATELVYGAKLAWRNAARCIGRIQWSKLQVFDCRSLTTSKEMFQALCNHIRYSTNKGYIRSAITIFPQRTDGKHDFRVWNPQLIMYAGYTNEDGSITGDPANVEFTQECQKLGWHGNHGMFDILPLVLSADGEDPEMFPLPKDLVLEVKIIHPTYEWFEELGLKWYAVPAVSSMMFDCGGLQFPGAPFNGWYMSTEIACRDFCDPNRYNITETVAKRMGLDTSTNSSLWKDKAVLEVNMAVIYSFQKQNVTIVDHHTASETFMKHYENEQRLRNGIPGDWVWIVPPMSSHLMSVYHQEFANYLLFPAYLYQQSPWKTHEWKSTNNIKEKMKKHHIKIYARMIKVTSKMFGTALSKRIKATILYATETGKSEMYARQLSELFSHAFHPKVYRMDEYDVSRIEHEALLLVIVSTFGNGDPPENGQTFANHLHSLALDELNIANEEDSRGASKTPSFIKANSVVKSSSSDFERCDSTRSSVADDSFGILSTVRFSVFGLGSSAYPNFCSFGAYIDKLLGDLGGERILRLAKGDELCGQEQTFKQWAGDVFRVACNDFCLDVDENLGEATKALDTQGVTESTCQFAIAKADNLTNDLTKYSKKKVWKCELLNKLNLLGEETKKTTLQLVIGCPEEMTFEPGDHVGVFPKNRDSLVDGIIRRLISDFDPEQTVQLQFQREKKQGFNGTTKEWVAHERLPAASLKTMLSWFLDITTPASPALLKFLSDYAKDPLEKEKLIKLATDAQAYDDWKYLSFPHLLEVLEEFSSVQMKAELLVSQLRPLQPRFYSISSAPSLHPNQVHLTAAVIQYRAQDGKGPLHYGVASNYLNELNIGDEIYLYARRSLNFHLPKNTARPVIMIGPGTGIAPFRSFWQHRKAQRSHKKADEFGPMSLFFGCRSKSYDLYQNEKATLAQEGVLTEVHLALSREPSMPKTYVQDLMRKDADNMYSRIVKEKGHFYVCGDCSMAEDVLQTLKDIIKEKGNMSNNQVEKYIFHMRDEQRYHEDIFGITLRTAEVQTKSREKIKEKYQS